MSSAIRIDGLTKHFRKVQALTDLNLEVPEGTIYGFLGPNGSGKTTTLRILAGLSRPTRGRAFVNGVEVTPAGLHRHGLGFLAQEPKFYGWMTGREVLRYVARFFGPVDDAYLEKLLQRVGIRDAADRRTKTYSGGMRQRLGIAQALVGRPRLLILDEPASALDPVGRAEVLGLLQELRGETSIFFSTHILEDVQRCSDYVAILDRGRLITASRTDELLGRFSRGRLQVILSEAVPAEVIERVDGVLSVTPQGGEPPRVRYEVTTREGQNLRVQTALTRLAAERGLALLSADEVRLDLESVFLKLIGDASPVGSAAS